MGSAARFNHATFNPVLSEGLEEFDLIASQQDLVGLQIAPVLEVAKSTGEYKKAEVKDILKEYSTIRHNEGGYSRGTLSFTKDSYSTAEHGFEVPVDDREATVHSSYWDAELEAARLARDVVLRNHTRRVVTAALAGTSSTSAAASAWTNKSTADPVTDIDTARIAVKEDTGTMPNALCINWRVWLYLRDNDAIRDRLVNMGLVNASVQPQLSRAVVAQALDLDYLFVSGGQRNASVEPTAPSALTDIWDNTKALVFVYNNAPSLRAVQYMRTLHWGEDGSTLGGAFDTYYNDAVRGQVFRQRMETAEKVIVPEAGYILTSVA